MYQVPGLIIALLLAAAGSADAQILTAPSGANGNGFHCEPASEHTGPAHCQCIGREDCTDMVKSGECGAINDIADLACGAGGLCGCLQVKASPGRDLRLQMLDPADRNAPKNSQVRDHRSRSRAPDVSGTIKPTPRIRRGTPAPRAPDRISMAITVNDCTFYGGTVQKDKSCASSKSCLINGNNGCIDEMDATKNRE